MSPLTLQSAARGLAALGNPTRLALLRALVRAGEPGLTVGELQRRVRVPASTLAHHLATLVQSGLLSQSRHGREVICRAAYAAISALAAFLLEECCAESAE